MTVNMMVRGKKHRNIKTEKLWIPVPEFPSSFGGIARGKAHYEA